ncbi:TfuA-like protein [Neorhizobium galegae]|uniref:TfuA-like protein n=1 Tax=Neorhizobium galegae TaxID=399 RepID=UPI0006213E84|nr:TfuA-like protein [Neorhizobium galegae]KAA9383787.1 antibiotic resistance protein [Neorhizobium galegae]CDZ29926.1 TfuA domain protein CorE [Neorhizobium galegae bv. officinalis]
MKFVFVGPSLPDARRFVADDMIVAPPAMQGDVRRAIDKGAQAIGVIDGAFEYVAPVWHKEILYALSKGVAVFGAASMGALRAAECHAFGMIGVGEIFKGYANETLIDDADVALLHGPQELGFVAITVPMVNVDATVARCCAHGLISEQEAQRLKDSGRSLFFKGRNWNAIVANCREIMSARADELARILAHHYVDQKRADALAMIDAMRKSAMDPSPASFEFHRTSLWRDG